MKWSRVALAWIVISMVVAVGAVAQVASRPVPPPPMPWINEAGTRPMGWGHGVVNNCTVRIMGSQNNGRNALACRCYMSPEGAACEVMPRSFLLRVDSMREGRMDERMDRRMEKRMGGRLPDSMRMRIRIRMDSMRMDSMRIRIDSMRGRVPPRRP